MTLATKNNISLDCHVDSEIHMAIEQSMLEDYLGTESEDNSNGFNHVNLPSSPPKLCACGCGECIIPKPHHKYRLVRYINGHQSRGRLNPMYGRRGELAPSSWRVWTEEMRKKVGDKNRGEKNGMYGREGNLHPRFNNIDIKLTQKQIEILEGELLGDGYLYRMKKTHNACFILGSVEGGHVKHISKVLPSEVFGKKPFRLVDNSRGYGDGKIWRLDTLHLPIFTKSYERWYPNGKKIVPKDLILTPTTCSYWYIGDGTYNKEGHTIGLFTNSFSADDIDNLVNQLRERGIECKRQKIHTRNNRKLEWYIAINVKGASTFLKYIGEPILDCYRYKWSSYESSYSFWSGDEVGVLKKFYPDENTSMKEMVEKLPTRSKDSIKSMAHLLRVRWNFRKVKVVRGCK